MELFMLISHCIYLTHKQCCGTFIHGQATFMGTLQCFNAHISHVYAGCTCHYFTPIAFIDTNCIPLYIHILLFTCCMHFIPAPAIIDPGDNTTTDVPEEGIRYFQVTCDSFSDTVLVELFDNTGTSFLYCSATEANPGPQTSNTVVNDTVGISPRTCVVSLANTNSKVCF